MNAQKLYTNLGIEVDGPLLFTSDIFEDSRGYFTEIWNSQRFNKLIGKEIKFVQDNHSSSFKGVLRGLHFQIDPRSQGKLIRCSKGNIFDVIVDVRRNSKSFSQWAGIHLNDEHYQQLWIPSGFAHGFLTLSDIANIEYKTTDFWSQKDERTISYEDSNINIIWPEIDCGISLSEKDLKANYLENIDKDELIFMHK